MGKHSSHALLPLFPGARRFAEGRWWATCFAHDDDRASLLLSKNDHGWRYHCYVCGADGDAVDVLMKRDGKTYGEALRALQDNDPVPPRLYRDPYRWLAICDSCGVEEIKIRDVGHLVELRDRGDDSWEIAPDGVGCVGPVCLRTLAFPHLTKRLS